jgi:hypothetical protein
MSAKLLIGIGLSLIVLGVALMLGALLRPNFERVSGLGFGLIFIGYAIQVWGSLQQNSGRADARLPRTGQ